MGLFNRTEEEIRIENEKKNLKEVKEIIKSSKNIDGASSSKLISYIDKVLDGGKNDFFENDFLCRALVTFTDIETNSDSDISVLFDKTIKCLKELFPEGIETKDYKELKEYFINSFLGENGYLNKGLYDNSLFNIMSNYKNTARVMNTISSNEKAIENIKSLKEYIRKSSKYAIDEETFVKSLVSTISNLDISVLDVDNYLISALEEDKKRVGIYSISHDDIMMANSALTVINSKIEKIDDMISNLEEKTKDVRKETTKGIHEIHSNKEQAIRDLRNYKSDLIIEMKKILDENLENVKIEINNKADAVFSELLKKYQEQLDDIRKMGQTISDANSRQLTFLKSETDKSLNQLKEYVSNNSELHMYLDKLEQSGEIKDKLLDLIEKEKIDFVPRKIKKNETVIEGIENIVVPHELNIALPKTISLPDDIQIIPPYAYKNRIERDKRMMKIKDEMSKREAKGEIFHKKTEEVIGCLINGEWPYIYGPSGAGKGHTVDQIGSLLNQQVVKSGKIVDNSSIFGFIDAQGRFRTTPCFEACVNGNLIFFDEFDNGNPYTCGELNDIYSTLEKKISNPSSKQYLQFANQIYVPLNPNMRMLAAGNTDGSGANAQFSGRDKIDESVQERYTPIYFGYDNRVEKKIFDTYEDWYYFFIAFREACLAYATSQSEKNAHGTASTRDAIKLKSFIDYNSKTLDTVMSQYFVQDKDEDYRFTLANYIINKYKQDYNGLNVDVDTDYGNYMGELALAKKDDIARQFVKRCKTGTEE